MKKVVLAIIVKDQKILLTKRAGDVFQGGFWEFPGGKVEADESMKAALRRELEEELGIIMQSSEFLLEYDFHYPEKTLQFHCFLVTEFKGEPQMLEDQEGMQWVPFDQLSEVDFPEANLSVVGLLEDRFL